MSVSHTPPTDEALAALRAEVAEIVADYEGEGLVVEVSWSDSHGGSTYLAEVSTGLTRRTVPGSSPGSLKTALRWQLDQMQATGQLEPKPTGVVDGLVSTESRANIKRKG